MVFKALDMVGFKGKNFKVIKRSRKKGGQAKWVCKCVCGEKFIAAGTRVRRQKFLSCGCKVEEERKLRYANSKRYHLLDEHKVWKGMLRRCYDENYKDYERYGAKGIKVSKSWKNSFETFHSDMGKSSFEKA